MPPPKRRRTSTLKRTGYVLLFATVIIALFAVRARFSESLTGPILSGEATVVRVTGGMFGKYGGFYIHLLRLSDGTEFEMNSRRAYSPAERLRLTYRRGAGRDVRVYSAFSCGKGPCADPGPAPAGR